MQPLVNSNGNIMDKTVKQLPKSNIRKYYFGINLINGMTIITTSTYKLCSFLNISRATYNRHLKTSSYYVCDKYIIGITDDIIKQDKGSYKRMREMNSIFIDSHRQHREYLRSNM